MTQSDVPLSSRRLAALMAFKGMQVPDLAAAIHVDTATVSEFLRQGFGPGAAAILGIAFPGVDTMWLAGSAHERGRCPIPHYNDEAMEAANLAAAVPAADPTGGVIAGTAAGTDAAASTPAETEADAAGPDAGEAGREAGTAREESRGLLRVEVLNATAEGAESDGRFSYLAGAAQKLEFFGLRAIRVRGGAMAPLARDGDVALFGPVEAADGEPALVVWREEYTIMAAFRRYFAPSRRQVRLEAECKDVDAVSLKPLYPHILLPRRLIVHAWKYIGAIIAP